MDGQVIGGGKRLQLGGHKVEILRVQRVAQKLPGLKFGLHEQKVAVIHGDSLLRGFGGGEREGESGIGDAGEIGPRGPQRGNDGGAVKGNGHRGVFRGEEGFAIGPLGEGGRPVVEIPPGGGKAKAGQEIAAGRLLRQDQQPRDRQQGVGGFIGGRQGDGGAKIRIGTGQIMGRQGGAAQGHILVGGLRGQGGGGKTERQDERESFMAFHLGYFWLLRRMELVVNWPENKSH